MYNTLMRNRVYKSYYLIINSSSIFIFSFFGFICLSFSFELPHSFTILEEATSHILIQYQVQKFPSLAEIQADISDTTSEQATGNPPSHKATVGRQAANIVHRTLIGIPENVEPSLEIIQEQREQLPKETAELLLKLQTSGIRLAQD